MQFIINEKILSIPPYISTTWENVCSLHIERGIQGNSLVITLTNGASIPIPNLGPDILTKVFHTHTLYISTQTKQKPQEPSNKMMSMENMIGLGFPMKLGVGGIEGLGAAIQHNPEQANSPDLPKEVLDKISAVAKIMDADQSLTQSLKAEPHCNCIHCQIARAIAGEIKENKTQEEEVTEEDLKFRTWDITQSGDRLYTVSNPLDTREHYSVFLGEPLGCTCGQKNCEHIKAVLNT